MLIVPINPKPKQQPLKSFVCVRCGKPFRARANKSIYCYYCNKQNNGSKLWKDYYGMSEE